MRMLKFVFPMILAFGIAAGVRAEEKGRDNKPREEVPQDQTGSLTGTLHMPEKEAPKGATAALHQGSGAGETIFFLFAADGNTEKKLKDLAKKGATATVTGVITKDGYRVTSVSTGR